MKQKLLALAVVSALALGASTATLAATTYAPFGNASIVTPPGYTGGHAAQLVTVDTGALTLPAEEIWVYSGVSLASTTVTTLSDLTVLEIDYRIVAGDCGGGSPRFSIGFPEDKGIGSYIYVSIGPPATGFTGCAAGWHSEDMLADARVWVNGVAYTWAQAKVLLASYGYSAVSSISLVVDGGGPGGRQTVLVDNVKINEDKVTFEPDTTMIIPLVAQTGVFTSEITVRNPYNAALPISVSYTGATGTSAAGEPIACTPLSVPPLGTAQFALAQQCELPSGRQFGYVTLTESTGKSPFVAYSRQQGANGIGFSVPAYPVGAIEVPEFGHYVVGLTTRKATAPNYQSNCFVASMDAATPYQIRLLDSDGISIGTVTGSLEAHQMVRYLDIFEAAGVPAGDRSNVSAVFTNGVSTAPLIGLCTVQENTNLSADFRMAQPAKAWRYNLD